MKCPSKMTTKERYNFLLGRHNGNHATTMQAAYNELALQLKSKAQDHPEIKRNIAKVKEFINYGENINNKID